MNISDALSRDRSGWALRAIDAQNRPAAIVNERESIEITATEWTRAKHTTPQNDS